VEDFASTAAFVKSYRKPARGCLTLDQHLPMITGIDSLRSAVGRELGILVIGQGDPTLEHRARDAGVAEYPQKPIALKVLLDTIEQVIDAA
jgi:FixJ family two-component response regulator